MNNIIKLDNNYYIKIINNDNEIHIDTIDIYHLGLIQVIKDKNMILRIDFNKFNIKDYKRILKNLLRIKEVSNIINKEFGIIENGKKIIAYVLNFNETNSKHKDFISGINAIFYKKNMKDIIIYMIQYVIILMFFFMEIIYVILKIINVEKKEIHHVLQDVVIILNIKHSGHFQN